MDTQVLEWARDIKAELAAHGLQAADDWELYRLASVCKEDKKNAVQRVKKMREFESKHKLEMVEPAKAFDVVNGLREVVDPMLCGRDKEGRLVFFVDMAKHKPSVFLTDDETLKHALRHSQQIMHSLATSVEDFEKGYIFVIQTRGMKLSSLNRRWDSYTSWMYQTGYPVKMKKMVVLGGGVIFTAALKIAKLFLTEKVLSRLLHLPKQDDVYAHIHETSLPAYNGLGTVTNEDMVQQFKKRLEAYQAHRASFSLPL